MNTSKQHVKIKSYFRLLPYVVAGTMIFSLNSLANMNYLFRGYLTLLEAQTVILIVLFVAGRLTNKSISSNHLE